MTNLFGRGSRRLEKLNAFDTITQETSALPLMRRYVSELAPVCILKPSLMTCWACFLSGLGALVAKHYMVNCFFFFLFFLSFPEGHICNSGALLLLGRQESSCVFKCSWSWLSFFTKANEDLNFKAYEGCTWVSLWLVDWCIHAICLLYTCAVHHRAMVLMSLPNN